MFARSMCSRQREHAVRLGRVRVLQEEHAHVSRSLLGDSTEATHPLLHLRCARQLALASGDVRPDRKK